MNTSPTTARRKWVLLGTAGGLAALITSVIALINASPAFGPQAADSLRVVMGDDAVAHIESAVYGVQDALNQRQYLLGLKRPQSPFAPLSTPAATSPAVATSTTPSLMTSHLNTQSRTQSLNSSTTTSVPTWMPHDLVSFTKVAGEGQWQPYIQDVRGRTVAYRTFLNPDPQRPYVSVGIVAFDLSATRLNFVLGSQEPRSHVQISRPGVIPPSDTQANKLLAVFNGGWKVEHGHYGVMVNDVTVVPPKPGLMTVLLGRNGDVRMGVWGEDVAADHSTLAWRQNNVPLIHKGEINPRTSTISIADWGSALNGNVAVWRSALGLSQDGRTLYYAAGDSLLVSAMAKALGVAGAYEAMQLDVNNYWVHFDAIRVEGSVLKPEALFPSMAKQDDDRYLRSDTRDFFYITARNV